MYNEYIAECVGRIKSAASNEPIAIIVPTTPLSPMRDFKRQ